MSAAGTASFTVTGGIASAVTVVGTLITDGSYQINVVQDNSGTTLSVSTPNGAAQSNSIRSSQSANS